MKQLEQVPVCVSGFVTTTLTLPAACAGVTPVIEVGEIVETVSADPPNETAAPVWKPVPATVTDVPPLAGPLVGVTELTVGPATYVKQPLQLALWVSGFVTITFTAPAACAVVVPVMVVALMVETFRGEPPKDTLDPLTKLVPATVTEVPPELGPRFGVTEATVGAATYVKQPLHDPLCVSGFVTTTVTAPAACAVVVPVMLVGLTVGAVSADPPNETVAPVWNPLPVMVTLVPPPAGPLVGATELTVGAGARYVKQPVHVALCVSGFVTTMLTAPAACAAVVPVMVVELVVETVSADPPSDTVAPVWKPVPAIVTAVPPAIAPVVGAIDATVGAGAT